MENPNHIIGVANQRPPKERPHALFTEQYAPKSLPIRMMNNTETRQGAPKTPPRTTQQTQTNKERPSK